MASPTGRVVPFTPPARRRIHEDVADQLRDAIVEGRYGPGEKLPAERELADAFRVNRTSVREAIKVLESLGLVAVRQGDGVTVRPLVDASFSVLPSMILHGGRIDTTLLSEMNEVITPLLREMARLAISRCRPTDVIALRRIRDGIADATRDREARFALSRDLIVALADITGNRIWQMLARRLRELLAAPPLAEARRRLKRDPGLVVPVIDGCLAAVEAGQTEDAVAALHRFITTEGNALMQVEKGSHR